MSFNLPLDHLSVAEKLQILEAVWASLCQKPTDVASPAWHEQVLAERTRRLEAGEARVSDWNDAKQRLLCIADEDSDQIGRNETQLL